MAKDYNNIVVLNNRIDQLNKQEDIVYKAFDYIYLKLMLIPKAYIIRREIKKLEKHFFKDNQLIYELEEAAKVIDRMGLDSYLDHWKETKGLYIFTREPHELTDIYPSSKYNKDWIDSTR